MVLKAAPRGTTFEKKRAEARAKKLEDAQKAYAEAERRVKEKLATDAVLVSVDSISSLSRAYPNYYADTSMFLTLLNEALNGLRHG